MMFGLKVLLLLAATFSADPSGTDSYLGVWQEEGDSGAVLWFEEQRCGRLRDKQPTFYRVVYSEDRAQLESWGRVTTLNLRREGDVLLVTEGELESRFLPLQEVPIALQVKPYDLPGDVELDSDTIAVLGEDLGTREAEDQRVRIDPTQRGRMQSVDEDNTAFLLNVIQEVGWIDAKRFGRESAYAAFLLVQHSRDLRLLRTAQPLIQKDVEAGLLEGQAYALLFDRLQLRLGFKQRYGSQIGILDGGVQVLMPCEDYEAVDRNRSAVGLGPLADYLALFEDEGQPVQRLEAVLGQR